MQFILVDDPGLIADWDLEHETLTLLKTSPKMYAINGEERIEITGKDAFLMLFQLLKNIVEDLEYQENRC